MKFKIGSPVHCEYRKQYVLEIHWEHGDADANTSDEYPMGLDELDATVTNFLVPAEGMFRRGMGGSDTYEAEFKRNGLTLADEFCDMIPTDMFSSAGDACLNGYEVVWYNENGVKHPVEIVL